MLYFFVLGFFTKWRSFWNRGIDYFHLAKKMLKKNKEWRSWGILIFKDAFFVKITKISNKFVVVFLRKKVPNGTKNFSLSTFKSFLFCFSFCINLKLYFWQPTSFEQKLSSLFKNELPFCPSWKSEGNKTKLDKRQSKKRKCFSQTSYILFWRYWLYKTNFEIDTGRRRTKL